MAIFLTTQQTCRQIRRACQHEKRIWQILAKKIGNFCLYSDIALFCFSPEPAALQGKLKINIRNMLKSARAAHQCCIKERARGRSVLHKRVSASGGRRLLSCSWTWCSGINFRRADRDFWGLKIHTLLRKEGFSAESRSRDENKEEINFGAQ